MFVFFCFFVLALFVDIFYIICHYAVKAASKLNTELNHHHHHHDKPE